MTIPRFLLVSLLLLISASCVLFLGNPNWNKWIYIFQCEFFGKQALWPDDDFSGIWHQYMDDRNGDWYLSMTCEYKDGVQHGKRTMYHQDGLLSEIEHLVNGEPDKAKEDLLYMFGKVTARTTHDQVAFRRHYDLNSSLIGYSIIDTKNPKFKRITRRFDVDMTLEKITVLPKYESFSVDVYWPDRGIDRRAEFGIPVE